nr:hypothetical protein [Tanacetum cinerariifolium]
VFREWGSKSGTGRVLSFLHKNKGAWAQTLCENECKRVRSVRHDLLDLLKSFEYWKAGLVVVIRSKESELKQSKEFFVNVEVKMALGVSVRQWIVSNAQQVETALSVIEEQALEIGSRKSVRMLFGRHDLLDLLKSFEYWKAGLVVVDSNSYIKSKGSIEDFVSFREMITSQLIYLKGRVFRKWGSKNGTGRVLSFSHKNKGARAQTLYENECKRVRLVRQWIESNVQQAETGQSVIEEQALEIGSCQSIRMLFGRHDLLDFLKVLSIGKLD